MSSTIPARTRRAVLLPGTGSDEVFVASAFAAPLADAGIELCAPVPAPGAGLLEGLLTAVDEAAGRSSLLVGGVSLGAHLATEWALANPGRCSGLLLAMPGWLGDPGAAPAAMAARLGAARIEQVGLPAALQAATEGVPDWLADELRRAWLRQGPALAQAMSAGAAHPAPTAERLHRIKVPAAVVGCTDDPVHPAAIARSWAGALPAGRFAAITLAELGADRQSLGRVTLSAWRCAAGTPAAPATGR